LTLRSIETGLKILKGLKLNRLHFLKLNYFFYSNLILKKSDEIGKRKKNLIK